MAFNPMENMIDLKGKQYLQVMWRLVWFREEHKNWCIETDLVQVTETSAIFRARIIDDADRMVSTGYGSESVKDFKDFLEKAETKAVGRALAMLGYGTQFAPELDEGERIVDSPVQTKPMKCNETQVSVIKEMCTQRNVNIDKLAKQYKANKIDDITYQQAEDAIMRLGS